MSALWTPAELRAATGGLLRRPFTATGVSIDTRTLRPGDLFVALVGENGDGHDHVAAALARGAAGALVHRLPDGIDDDAPLLQVADTLAGLGALAAHARARFGGRVVAVTGSVGKTTTKEMLRAILMSQGKTWAAEASHNNHWGVPLTLARLPAGHRFAVVEIGMNHAGEIAPLSRLARPHVALVTNVAPAHIGHLGSIEAIAREKAAVMAGLEPGGVAVLPADSMQLGLLRAAAPGEVVLFGADEAASFRLLAHDSDAAGVRVLASAHGLTLNFAMAAPGGHMAADAVAAIAAAAAMGVDPTAAALALEGFAPVAGRGVRRTIPAAGGEAVLLDESYNASAVAVRAALAVLALQPGARRIAVLGDMLELGEAGPAEHMGLLPALACNADLVFACGALMRPVFDALPESRRGAWAADSAALAPLVAGAVRAGDAVLVKGSLGSRMAVVVRALDRDAD